MSVFRKFTGFATDRRANVSMIFALAMIPMIAVAGFAIDLQLAFSKKGKVQYALDSAALAGARLMQSTNSQGKVRKHGEAYFEAMLDGDSNGQLDCEKPEFDFDTEDELTINVLCSQPTTLTRIIGRDEVKFAVSSTSTYGVGQVDVAFVFDISGSMNSHSRLTNLKLAAIDAVETLLPEEGSRGEGDVRIAMTAYNGMVDAGDFFEEATGLKKRRTYVKEIAYTTTEEREVERDGWHEECGNVCLWEHPRYGCLWQRWQCDWVEGPYTTTEEVEVEATREVEYTLNSSCVYERHGLRKFSDTQPTQLGSSDLVDRLPEGALNASETSNNSEGYLTSGYAYWEEDDRYADGGRWRTRGTDCLSVKPFELSSNELMIKAYITALYANGSTAGHQGIEWGWYLISPNWKDVFDGDAEPLPYDKPDTTKAMIIMTDGEFNAQYHSSQGNSTNQAKDLCDSIKEEGVIIYTIAFQAPKAGEEVLEYCASGGEFAFKAKNGEELLDSYKAIASSISDLRIKL